MSDEHIDAAMNVANQSALSRSVEVVVTAHTGNPLVGRMAGDATKAAYDSIPGEVKIGAGGAALATVSCAAKAYTLGTVGGAAFAGSAIAAAPVIIVAGAVAGFFWWLCKD